MKSFITIFIYKDSTSGNELANQLVSISFVIWRDKSDGIKYMIQIPKVKGEEPDVEPDYAEANSVVDRCII